MAHADLGTLIFIIHIIHVFNKYARTVPLKDEKANTTTNAFQKILDGS